jgi:hypothetical protein
MRTRCLQEFGSVRGGSSRPSRLPASATEAHRQQRQQRQQQRLIVIFALASLSPPGPACAISLPLGGCKRFSFFAALPNDGSRRRVLGTPRDRAAAARLRQKRATSRTGGGSSEASEKKKALLLLLVLRQKREESRGAGEAAALLRQKRAESRARGGASEASKKTALMLFCGKSGQHLGLSGGDPPNPPLGRRGRTGCLLGRARARV